MDGWMRNVGVWCKQFDIQEIVVVTVPKEGGTERVGFLPQCINILVRTSCKLPTNLVSEGR